MPRDAGLGSFHKPRGSAASPGAGANRIDAERDGGGSPPALGNAPSSLSAVRGVRRCRLDSDPRREDEPPREALDGVARCSGVDAKRGTPRSFPLRAASRARSAAAMALVPPRPKPISAITAPKQVPGPAPGGTRRGLLGLRAPASSISRGAPRVGVPGVPSPPRLLLAVRLPSGCTLLPRLFARNARRDWSTAHPRVSMPVPVRFGGRAYGVLPAFVRASSRSVPRLETGIVAKDARSSRCLQVRAFAVSPPGFARAHRVSPRATKRRRGHVPAATCREMWPTLAASSVGFDLLKRGTLPPEARTETTKKQKPFYTYEMNFGGRNVRRV